MKKHGRKDVNQKQLETVFKAYGFTTYDTSSLGDGFPDFIAGKDSNNYLIEVKDGSKPPSKQRLTPMEERFHRTWRGNVHVLNSEEQAERFCKEFS